MPVRALVVSRVLMVGFALAACDADVDLEDRSAGSGGASTSASVTATASISQAASSSGSSQASSASTGAGGAEPSCAWSMGEPVLLSDPSLNISLGNAALADNGLVYVTSIEYLPDDEAFLQAVPADLSSVPPATMLFSAASSAFVYSPLAGVKDGHFGAVAQRAADDACGFVPFDAAGDVMAAPTQIAPATCVAFYGTKSGFTAFTSDSISSGTPLVRIGLSPSGAVASSTTEVPAGEDGTPWGTVAHADDDTDLFTWSTSADLFAQRFDASGAATAPPTDLGIMWPRVWTAVATPAGAVLVYDPIDDSDGDLRVRRLDESNAQTGVEQLFPWPGSYPVVSLTASAVQGGTMVVIGEGDTGDHLGLLALAVQPLDANGAPNGPSMPIPITTKPGANAVVRVPQGAIVFYGDGGLLYALPLTCTMT